LARNFGIARENNLSFYFVQYI
jgi:hypothetical protein